MVLTCLLSNCCITLKGHVAKTFWSIERCVAGNEAKPSTGVLVWFLRCKPPSSMHSKASTTHIIGALSPEKLQTTLSHLLNFYFFRFFFLFSSFFHFFIFLFFYLLLLLFFFNFLFYFFPFLFIIIFIFLSLFIYLFIYLFIIIIFFFHFFFLCKYQFFHLTPFAIFSFQTGKTASTVEGSRIIAHTHSSSDE